MHFPLKPKEQNSMSVKFTILSELKSILKFGNGSISLSMLRSSNQAKVKLSEVFCIDCVPVERGLKVLELSVFRVHPSNILNSKGRKNIGL